VAKLNNLFLSKKDEFETNLPVFPANVITALYFLGNIGITDQNMQAEAYSAVENGGDESINNLYGLAHIVITNSNYYSNYVNPLGFPKETALAQSAIPKTTNIDLLTELVISLKLLGKATGSEVTIGNQKIIDSQHSDGSWGGPEDDPEHTTLGAALALMDFSKNFRKTDSFCMAD